MDIFADPSGDMNKSQTGLETLDSLGELSPFLREILIVNVLEKDLETFDSSAPMSSEDTEKVLGFLAAMEYQRKKSPRHLKRKRVNGQFSAQLKSIYRQTNIKSSQK